MRRCNQPRRQGTEKMANDLMLKKKNELAPADLGDPFAEYADAIAPQYIIR